MDTKERFSLLLLEPNEIYFEDFAVLLLPEANATATVTATNASSTRKSSAGSVATRPSEPRPGRLKMCSKSLVFIAQDAGEAIVKLAYRDCAEIYHWPQGLFETNADAAEVLAIRCTQWTELPAGSRPQPYRFVAGKRLLRFRLLYARVEQHLQLQNDMIATIVFSRHNRCIFDPLWLEDFNEPIVTEHTVDEISPLVTNPGRLLLTNRNVYFQPYNNILPYPVRKLALEHIGAVTQRRFLLRHTGLEIHYTDPANSPPSSPDPFAPPNQPQQPSPPPTPPLLLYVAFRTVADRTTFCDRLHAQSGLRLAPATADRMALRWQNGLVSNYDYLLHLNSLADRTVQDLTQYPIFPWVLTDYESAQLDLGDERVFRDLRKPMGALDERRLRRLHEKWESEVPKYLYGSHYSAPGLVLFYLVRRHPALMLCLQNGRFDHPDRMFNGVAETFANCLHNMGDFKELIPEFYDVEAADCGGFLVNTSRTDFGVRHTGETVGNVRLPPWAAGSPVRFVQRMRDALESDYVSRNLHHWIDLIFGYKQRGKEALKADNLFYHLCYEGSVDLDSIPDRAARHALEVQISEFGQIPKQLFDRPHAQRRHHHRRQSPATPPKHPQISALQLCSSLSSHSDLIFCVNSSADGRLLMSAGKDGLLQLYRTAELCASAGARLANRGIALAKLPVIAADRRCKGEDMSNLPPVTAEMRPLSAAVPMPGSNRIVVGSWNHTITTYNMDSARITNQFVAHEAPVSSLSLVDSNDYRNGLLVSGSWDGSVKIWSDFSCTADPVPLATLQLDDKIATLHARLITEASAADGSGSATNRRQSASPQLHVLIGTFAGGVHLWRPQLGGGGGGDGGSWLRSRPDSPEVRLLHTHRDEVTAVRLEAGDRGEGGGGGCQLRAASCGLDGVLLVADVRSGMQLMRAEHSAAWCCLDWPQWANSGDDGGGGDWLVLGDDRGALVVWNVRTGELERQVPEAFGGSGGGDGGLVSAVAACRLKAVVAETPDELLVVAAGVDYPRDFGVKLFRVVLGEEAPDSV